MAYSLRKVVVKGSWIYVCVANASLLATTATWQAVAAPDTWSLTANWASPPPLTYPGQAAGDVAIYDDTFTTGIVTCNHTLASPITLGEIRYGKATATQMQLRSDQFVFDSGIAGTPAQINMTSGSVILRFATVGPVPTINLVSPLVANLSAGTFLVLGSSLIGSAPLTVNGTGGSGQVTLTNGVANTNPSLYTFNQVGLLFGCPNGTTFPGDLLLTAGSSASIQGGGLSINQFALTSNIDVQGSALGLGGTLVIQAANTLTISQGGDVDGHDNLTERLALHNATTALKIKGGTFRIPNLLLPNGGAIAYDTSLPGEGVAIMGDSTYASTIDLTGHTVDLNIDRGSDTCALFDMKMINEQFLNGGALVKNRAGTLLFEGTNILPSLTINEGKVVFGSSLSDSVTFNSGATLQINPNGSWGGSGRLVLGNNGFITNAGTLEPGSSSCVGELTIDGTYFQTEEGTLRIKIRDGVSDRLTVNEGGVCLKGTLCVDAAGCLSDCDSFLIVDNSLGSGISGCFSCVTANGVPSSLFMTLVKEPKALFVEFIPSPASQLSARALSQLNLVNEHTLNLLDRLQAVRYRFGSTSTRGSAAQNSVTLRASRGREDLVMAGDPSLSRIETDNFWAGPSNQPASLYIAPLGIWGENDGTECVEGFDFHSVGGLIGADYAWDRAGLGALLGYESLHGDIDHSIGDFRIHSLFLQGYTTFLPLENHNWFFDLIASASYNWQHLNRDNDVTAKPHSWEYDGYIGTGYNVALGKEWRVTPLVAMQYIHVDVDSFHEENSCGDSLCFDDEKFHTWRSWAGLSFEGRLEKANATWMPELVGYWQYQFDTQHTLDVSTLNTHFTREVDVFTGDHNLGIVGARLRALFGNKRNWSLAGAYHYFWGKNLSMNALYFEAGWNF